MESGEYRDVDVLIEISHLRQPFVQDLVGVIMTAAVAATKRDLDPTEALQLLVQRVMGLVDVLASEIVTECLSQTAEQMGGSLLDDEIFVEDFGA